MLFIKNPPPTSYVISSPLSGLLQKDGKPLPKTKIIRRLRWNSNEDGIEQEFYSDENGYFDLPAHEETLEIPALVQFVAKTDLYAIIDGERDQFWFSSKMDKDMDSEFESTPLGVVCDLESEEFGVNINGGLCLTKCVWENMPKEDDPNVP
ncbi:DUF6795 domain-containing protein [Teredinibacter turnerae]|uniref:DUF6795 domain-containing protein n=1 Tax=Teredinibacter turnerae TaxID=2426 RepID=UPI00039E95FC|nr:DUF6795 domain-containing protein [Teredinibacter turnerae]